VFLPSKQILYETGCLENYGLEMKSMIKGKQGKIILPIVFLKVQRELFWRKNQNLKNEKILHQSFKAKQDQEQVLLADLGNLLSFRKSTLQFLKTHSYKSCF